jgi:SAM-dependent methyltransferase
MPDHGYILGDTDDELARLRSQHEVWRDQTRQLYRRAGFRQGQTLLDVGCGPGFTTGDLLEIAGPDGRVIAIDSSPKVIEILNAEMSTRGISNVTGIVRDVTRLGDDVGPVDGALARWVLCYLDEPHAAVNSVAGILRPGGALAVIDYLNYRSITVEPASDLFDRAYRAVFESFRNRGGGLEVGRRVPALMDAAGLQVEVLEPIWGVGRPGSGIWNWLSGFQETYFPRLVEKGFLTQKELDDYNRFWTEISSRTDAFLSAPPMIGIVGRKA